MKWDKLGQIFNPSDHRLINGCITHAQSPQAVVFDDYVRVYFSTRAPDANGTFLSHVAFVEFEMNLNTIRQVNSEVVLPLGELGNFDEHGIFPLSPLRVGKNFFAYTTGWSRRVSVSVETGIGLVISEDEGLTFKRYGVGPILSNSLNEPFLVCDAFVRKFNNKFHMWYIFGTAWSIYDDIYKPERTYKIGHATSFDGINWHKDDKGPIVSNRLGEAESQALPTVININGRYHMFFCYRESFDFRSVRGRGYRIGHAWSDDLNTWIRDDENPSLLGTEGEWDSDMQCYPHVFYLNKKVFMLYNGNDFGSEGFGLAELVC